MNRGIFITGTDTGVGKTVITAGLGVLFKNSGIDVGVLKPIHTGCREEKGILIAPDTEFLKMAIGAKESLETITPYMLKMPLAPMAASRLEGREIDLQKIMSAYDEISSRHELTLVEGIGGIAVPIKKGVAVSDIIKMLNLPVIIVASPYLGTINHTLLTIRFAEINNIKIIGIIINYSQYRDKDFSEETNPQIIEDISGLPILGTIPYVGEINEQKNITGILYDTFSENIRDGFLDAEQGVLTLDLMSR